MNPNLNYQVTDDGLSAAVVKFWETYYGSMRQLHEALGRKLTQPIKDRNLGTTDAKHVSVFEQFCRMELALALGVSQTEVGPRRIVFKGHRSKKFDVCWPLVGSPKILISVKSMQNAYRNITNRVEEAFGDTGVLRLYRSDAAFGFFFFLLDGNVPRGMGEPGRWLDADKEIVTETGRSSGVPPFLDLIEEGGDFFDLAEVESYRKTRRKGYVAKRQDAVVKTEQTLMDLAALHPTLEPNIHYDSITFVPTRIKRAGASWNAAFAEVNPLLSTKDFISRLLQTAELRGKLT